MFKDFIIDDNGNMTEYTGNDTRIVIPEGVKKIYSFVFQNMESLEELSIPDSIEMIDDLNFEGCDNLRYNELGGARYLGNENNPYLVLVSGEDDIEKLTVAEGCKLIFANACADNAKLKRVSISESVRYIGFMAFYGCESLAELTLPEGVTHIESCAFDGTSIERLELPESLEIIENDAFSCVSLKEVTLPSGIRHIGCGAFTHNDIKFNEYSGGYYIGSKNTPYICFMKPCDHALTHIELHEETRLIYSSAFENCDSLTSVKLPDGLCEIGENSFKGCSKLTAIELPESVYLIEEEAFCGCTELKEIKLPSGKLEIGAVAFSSCESLLSVELGEATVGDNAFDGCVSLKKFKAGEGSNLYGDYIFAECGALEEVILPKALELRFGIEEFEDSENVQLKFI